MPPGRETRSAAPMSSPSPARRRLLLAASAALPAAAILAARPRLALAQAAPAAAVPPAEQPFDDWLRDFRRDALAQGISARTLDGALAGVAPIPRVIELDRKQPEGRLTFAEYRARIVSKDRIEKGRRLAADHAGLLRQAQRRYGVPSRVVLALWGMESNFGERPGTYSVVASLATLAHEGRRAAFFRKELVNALRIIDSGDVSPRDMTGSWAGAMGQSQFMPSTYLGYAVDMDGDGRRDIWRSVADVFGSTANYLSRLGWDPELRWGRPVSAPERAFAKSGLDYRAPLKHWRADGVRLPNGKDLPAAAIEASFLRMEGDADRAGYLVYPNFRTIMTWNRSTYFALCVGLLSDLIETG